VHLIRLYYPPVSAPYFSKKTLYLTLGLSRLRRERSRSPRGVVEVLGLEFEAAILTAREKQIGNRISAGARLVEQVGRLATRETKPADRCV
jgi:hypothetical protein